MVWVGVLHIAVRTLGRNKLRTALTLLGWPTSVSLTAIGIAFLFSLAVGIFFGYYPAYKASQLDPIEGLRYE